MESMNIKRNDGLVSFATLFGMCDYLTFPLGEQFFVRILVIISYLCSSCCWIRWI